MLCTYAVFIEYLTDLSFPSFVLHQLRIDYLCAPTMLVLSVELSYALVLLDVEVILIVNLLYRCCLQGQLLLLVSCYSHIHGIGHICRTVYPGLLIFFLADPIPLFSSDPDKIKIDADFFAFTFPFNLHMLAIIFARHSYIWVQIDELHA